MEVYAKQHPDFITITCLEWRPILVEDTFKDVIISSLRFLSKKNRIIVYGFVIMNNHLHLVWQIHGDHLRENVQRDFLKFTSQQILKELRNRSSPMQKSLLVNSKDRKHQIWERNSLSVPLWSDKVMWQKLEYIHENPVRAGLCNRPEEYKYSSAGFYLKNEKRWDFLVHIDG
jgi:REP element-mobilizing transposase RayT